MGSTPERGKPHSRERGKPHTRERGKHSTPGFALIEDPRFQEHRGPRGHPERPERLEAVAAALDPLRDALLPLPARAAQDDEVLRVHEPALLARVAEAAAVAPAQLDPDTYVSPRSDEIARLAAGAAIDLAAAVARGDADTGLAAVRPPGHHAEVDRAMGFCLFNNVAVAARALQAEHGVDKLLILDWDVHHGNGTQHAFEADPSVLYFSMHQFPFYPGTGAFEEIGVGRGEGATVNVPLPAGSGDAEYLGIMQRVLAPVAAGFRPEMILVSAGYDAHRDDPLASMQVSAAGYRAMTASLRAVADEICGGRLAFVLEGGYAASGLREGVSALLAATLEPAGPLAAPVAPKAGSVLARVLERLVGTHGDRFPDLGAA